MNQNQELMQRLIIESNINMHQLIDLVVHWQMLTKTEQKELMLAMGVNPLDNYSDKNIVLEDEFDVKVIGSKIYDTVYHMKIHNKERGTYYVYTMDDHPISMFTRQEILEAINTGRMLIVENEEVE